MRWLNETWLAANHLKNTGVSIVAITAWALLGAFGWDKLLTHSRGSYEPGIFDISGGQRRSTILAEMIKSYSKNERFHHPALDYPGWWQRSCRVIYGEDEFFSPIMSSSYLFAISGTLAPVLHEICQKRCLPVIEFAEIKSNNDHFPSRITINEYMEITGNGSPDLVICLTKDNLYQCINAGLDLFLDGESGYWEASPSGRLIKQDAVISLSRS